MCVVCVIRIYMKKWKKVKNHQHQHPELTSINIPIELVYLINPCVRTRDKSNRDSCTSSTFAVCLSIIINQSFIWY